MNHFQSRSEVANEIKVCRKAIRLGKHEKALKLSNQLGAKIFDFIKDDQTELRYLYFLDFKEVLLMITKCIRECRCEECIIRHFKNIFNLLTKMREDGHFPIEFRQKIGAFHNELIDAYLHDDMAEFFQEKKYNRKHHLILVN